MRVLHVIPALAPRYGGPSRVIVEMARALRPHVADVLVASTDADGSSARLPVTLGQHTVYDGVPAIFFARQWSESVKYSRPLERWLQRHIVDFDVVHIHAVFSHACLAAAQACWRWGIPYVVRPLGTLDPWSMRQKPTRKRLFWHLGGRQILARAAAVHYTTSEERRLAESSLGLTRGVVIPLGVDDAILEPSGPKADSLVGSHPYVLVLSRLHPKKGLDTFVPAFLRATETAALSHWRLVLAGDGDPAYVAGLRRAVDGSGAHERVLFSGWLDGDARTAALRGADLLALPSYQENFGLAVAEGLACGVPAFISPGVNLADDVRSAGAGWVAQVELQEQTEVLRAALSQPEERVRRGLAGQRLAAERFVWSAVARQLFELYQGLHGPPQR